MTYTKKHFVPIKIAYLMLLTSIVFFGFGYLYHTLQVKPNLSIPPGVTVYPTAPTESPKQLSYSPNGLMTVEIKIQNSNNYSERTQMLVLTTIKTSQSITLLQKTFTPAQSDWQETWLGFTSNNWSSSNKYIFMQLVDYKKGDLYVFRTDGKMFSNGKSYLLASQLGYSSDIIQQAYWQSPTQLIIVPQTGVINYVYLLDVQKETVQKTSAGD